MAATVRLGPEERAANLAAAGSKVFDIVVVGAGVTGAGAALDAAARGLGVILVEAHDIASGTSSRSGKTLHGGLRYLQQLNFSLVREAARERDLLVTRLAPYLARPTPFLVPLRRRLVSRGYYGAGVLLYDLVGAREHPLPRHRHLSRRGTLRVAPALRTERLVGGIQYHDAIVDDARLTLVLARTAAAYGAVVLTGTPAVGLLEEGGRVTGVTVHDADGGTDIAIRAHAVINATGVWSESLQELAGAARVKVRPAKGVHLVVPGDRIRSTTGLITPTADSVLVTRPWAGGRFWIVGTTDTPYEEDFDHVHATASDVDYLLEELNGWIAPGIGRDDIVSTYAALRPLVAAATPRSGEAGGTAAISRDYTVIDQPAGLVTIVGGKLTTYRVMAAAAVDHAARRLPFTAPPSPTTRLPLLGTHDPSPGADGPAPQVGLPDATLARLAGRYGGLLPELLALIAAQPDLAEPLAGAGAVLRAEIRYAATHEGARSLDDALTRRTNVAIETWDHGAAAAPEAADLLSDVLGWSGERQQSEVDDFRALKKETNL
jgi:glycerol-3-phosphate dehydrogenase